MIPRSTDFDLALDKTRIKDSRDGRRQEATVDAMLSRLFNADPHKKWEIQILADEVGMGKTFVALGTAYSVLDAMRGKSQVEDLRGCYQKTLVITPQNSALFNKWRREIGEFVKRCVKPECRDAATRWFAPAAVERLDELVVELRRSGAVPRVIVASMAVFGGGRLQNYDVKRRHLLATLFRYWGPRFKGDQRLRLLKGAPGGWPSDPKQLNEFTEAEWQQVLFSEKELRVGLQQLERKETCVEQLLETCREIATPFVRGRDELFAKVETQLVNVYRALLAHLINQSIPLVVVDEAHNWKNGPAQNANGYGRFTDYIGCRARRVVLLTATPFQLRPSEILEILKVSDHLRPAPTEAESTVRRQRMQHHRDMVVSPVLDRAAQSSRKFAKAWSRLPVTINRDAIAGVWGLPSLVEARHKLRELAGKRGIVSESDLESTIDAAIAGIDPDLRQLIREAMRLFVYNWDVSHELGAVVIRHRRQTEHRLFRVGSEYAHDSSRNHHRPDRHVLHASPGLNVRGDGELPHYLLMRCISEAKDGKGKSSLGSALTGCYSTLIDSAEGRTAKKQLAATETGRIYLKLLMKMVNKRQDHKHPKVSEVVDAVLQNWKDGEKSLIFCFRINTADRLHAIIDRRIRKELEKRRQKCMGGPESMKSLRTRLTGRDRDLIVIGLDRVLWSLLWCDWGAGDSESFIKANDFELSDEELPKLAELALRFGIDLLAERVDRVFLHRATECLIARRLLSERKPAGRLKTILTRIASEDWIRDAYALSSIGDDEERGTDVAQFDERGVHTTYEEVGSASNERISRVANELAERRFRARKQGQLPILDAYSRGPNLWVGGDPQTVHNDRHSAPIAGAIVEIHRQLFTLMSDDQNLDWESRRAALQSLRRAVLRESVLLRLLPGKAELDEAGWGKTLVQSFFSPLPSQGESMANRIAVFLEDLAAASGSLTDPGSARFALFDATHLRDQQFVAVVSGSTDHRTRERIFSGFNTPLLPEVLICTSVGQEGIDLHRHCRHVVHFDLAWNPAVLEQRTGRADRIGSKTFRERSLGSSNSAVFLEIGVPYLAGTYDERMYEELRLRAQTFEVLTGGDLASDDAEGSDEHKKSEGRERGLRFVALPEQMVSDLRVGLHVWSDRDRVPNSTGSEV